MQSRQEQTEFCHANPYEDTAESATVQMQNQSERHRFVKLKIKRGKNGYFRFLLKMNEVCFSPQMFLRKFLLD